MLIQVIPHIDHPLGEDMGVGLLSKDQADVITTRQN